MNEQVTRTKAEREASRPIRQRGVSLNIRNVNPDLKAMFKAYCARRGYEMQDAIQALMREAVEKGKILTMPPRRRRRY